MSKKETKSISVRMPLKLYERVEALAEREYISISGFIFNCLDKHMRYRKVNRDDIDLPSIEELVESKEQNADGR